MGGRRNQVIVIIIVQCVILVWLVLDRFGGTNPVRDNVLQVLSPVQYAVQHLLSPLTRVTDRLRSRSVLEDNLRDAEREIVALRNQIVILQEAQLENEILRRELSFLSASPTHRLLSAEVIGHDTSAFLSFLIIDRGAADGVERGMPVLALGALVGRVREVSATSAKVMLVTDPSSSVNGMVQRSRATGVVNGYPGGELYMRYLPQESEVEPGDVVLTSGLGGSFPKRLVIGQVIAVEQSDVSVFKSARLVPAADLRNLEAVMVLLSFSPLDDWQIELSPAEVPDEGS